MTERPTGPLRLAYADPPYVGRSRYYQSHPDRKRWDDPAEHVALMRHMDETFDGWALSCSSPSLRLLLPDAPSGARVAAWVKPWASFKPGQRVAYSWEPVIWRRAAPERDGELTGRDHLSAAMRMRSGVKGAKPEPFVLWLLSLLGWQSGDELHDLFPGTGVVADVLEAQLAAVQP